MIYYYFTNHFQGSLFQRFHIKILVIEEVDIPMYNTKAIEFINEKKQKEFALT